VLTFTESKT